MDSRAAAAREAHAASLAALEDAARHRERRDQLILQLRRDDPSWTYERLASVIGCSPELVAKIVSQARRQRL